MDWGKADAWCSWRQTLGLELLKLGLFFKLLLNGSILSVLLFNRLPVLELYFPVLPVLIVKLNIALARSFDSVFVLFGCNVIAESILRLELLGTD